MTDASKIKIRFARFIRERLSTGIELGLANLYKDSYDNFGFGKQAVDNYLEILYDADDIVYDRAMKSIKQKKKPLDEILALQISDLGSSIGNDEEVSEDE